MFVELVGSLRCMRAHEDTYLVASAEVTEGRHIVHGTLGCPVCGAEYPIRDGIAWFSERRDAVKSAIPATEYEALRCAALLNLTGTGGFALLCGDWGGLAPLLTDSVGVHLVLLNPPGHVSAGEGVSLIVCDAGLPLAAQTMVGVALDDVTARTLAPERSASVVVNGGRLVAPVDHDTPTGAQHLVSDDRHWVAQVAHPVLSTLTRRRG